MKRLTCALCGALLASHGAAAAEDLSEYILDPIYVTASRYEKKDLDIPASTQVFTQEDIQAMNAKSVMEVLANIPGFSISESPSGNGSPGFRGITGHLSILINGIPLTTEYYYQMGTLSMGGIERIEVVKGGSAVLYGSRASVGVVNIITKKGGASSVAVGVGNHSQKALSGNFSSEGLSLSLDWYHTKNAGLVYDSATQYYRKFLKRRSLMMQYEPNEHWNFMYLYNDKANLCTRFAKATGKEEAPWRNDTRYTMLQGTYKADDLRVTAYYQDRTWDSHLGSRHSTDTGKHYGIDVVNQWHFKGTKLTAGGTYEAIRAAQLSSGRWNDRDRNHGSLYFMTETPVAERTTILAGAREVFTGDSGTAFCPQVQVLQKLSDKESVYLNVNKSLLEPSLSQRYGYMSTTTTPNPNLKPEIGWTYEVGWKRSVNENGLVKIGLYHMKIDDRISTRKLADGTSQYYNVASYKNTGVEVSYEWSVPKGVSYGVGFSYGDPKAKDRASAPWTRTDQRLGAHGEVRYTMGKTSVNLFANYASQRYNSDVTGSLLSVDMNVRYQMTAQDELSLKVSNLLNRSDFQGDGKFRSPRVEYPPHLRTQFLRDFILSVLPLKSGGLCPRFSHT